MSEPGEKKRRKPKEQGEPSEVESPPRRARGEKKSAEAEVDVNGKREKKTRRQQRDEGEAELVADEVVVDMAEEEPPRVKKSRKAKKPVAEEVVDEEATGPSSEEDKKRGKGGKKEKPKVRSLAQSRRWDQEDLEVIVPDEEGSDETDAEDSSADHGSGGGSGAHGGGSGAHGGRVKQPAQTLELDEVLALPDSEKAHLDWLTRVMPDEVLRNIYAHLEPPSVDRTAAVCRRTNDLVQERSIWKVYLPEWSYVTKERFNKAQSRNGFAACYNYEMNEREKTKRRIEQAEYEQWLSDQSEWAKGFMTIFLFNRSIDFLSLFCFILGTCFAAARCQEAITWSWRLVLIPFYIPMLQLMLTPLVYDLCRKYYTSSNIDEVTESHIALWHVTFVKYRPYRPLIYLTNLALLIFWILLMIKLNDNYDGIPAGPLIIPWLLLIIALILEQLFGWASGSSWGEGRWVDRLYVVISCLLIALELLFVVFKLDKVVTWNWVLVLVPLWVYFGFTLTYPLCTLFWASCSYSMRSNIRIVDAESISAGFGVYFFCISLILTPILTWFALTALNLDGYYHRSWPVVFIPIFIIEGLLIVGCGLLDLINWCDN